MNPSLGAPSRLLALPLLTSLLLCCVGSDQDRAESQSTEQPASTHLTQNGDQRGEEKTGEVFGTVTLEGKNKYGEVTVTVFNGFDFFKTTSKHDGSYRVPFQKSTPNTYLAIFYTRYGYTPEIQRVQIPINSDSIRMDSICLSILNNQNEGSIVGVAYRKVMGGKIKRKYGIDSFNGGLEISIRGTGKEIRLDTNSKGFYKLRTPEGLYTIKTEQGFRADSIKVVNKKTTIQNLYTGRKMFD
jgi:hypothetical protein